MKRLLLFLTLVLVCSLSVSAAGNYNLPSSGRGKYYFQGLSNQAKYSAINNNRFTYNNFNSIRPGVGYNRGFGREGRLGIDGFGSYGSRSQYRYVRMNFNRDRGYGSLGHYNNGRFNKVGFNTRRNPTLGYGSDGVLGTSGYGNRGYEGNAGHRFKRTWHGGRSYP
jgi:hypothetical protein